MSILLLVLLGFLAVGCATAPHFKPSVPIKNTKSLEESLVICNEYELPEETRSSRPVSLKPYITCLDEAAKQHSTWGNTAFLVFDEELELLYSVEQESNWTPRRGQDLEAAVRAVLRTLWRSKLKLASDRYTEDEKRAVLEHFPKTAQILEATRWRVAPAIDLDPKLEGLMAGIASLRSNAAQSAKWGGGVSPSESQVCKDYLSLRSEVDYLSALWEDQRDMYKVAPESSVTTSLRQRYARRIELAQNELSALKSNKGSADFDARSCTR